MTMSIPSVLIVDDDLASQLLLRRMVENLGYVCDIASNGAEAVDAVFKRNFAAIFMDLYMPVMNGFDAASKIQEILLADSRPVYIVGMISLDSPSERQACKESGMISALLKPIHPVSVAQELLQASELKPALRQHPSNTMISAIAELNSCHGHCSISQLRDHPAALELKRATTRKEFFGTAEPPSKSACADEMGSEAFQ